MKMVKDCFKAVYGYEPQRHFFAPGRINLIGEHIDYNGGRVFPCAINMGTYGEVGLRDDRKVRFYSMNFESFGVLEIDLDDLKYQKEHDWVNYPKGLLSILEEHGYSLTHGIDIVYYGNIPNGSGLSSSASITVLTSWIVNTLFKFDLSLIECALFVQKTENEYMGVSTGIMDQFAIAMGKEKFAMLLDTSDLSYQYVPMDFEETSILIMNTCKRRELVTSAYNQRRSECDAALEIVKKHYQVNALCDLELSQLEAIKTDFEDFTIYQRARHAVTENERTVKAVKVLQANDAAGFGQLMNASHESLKTDYEVTGIELDTLVENAQKLEGVFGARVTGAGFGGCAIALVKNEAVAHVIETVGAIYKETIGYSAEFYTAVPSDGVREVV